MDGEGEGENGRGRSRWGGGGVEGGVDIPGLLVLS